METLELLSTYGVALLFVWILLEQVGVPLPAYPVLIVAGALLGRGEMQLLHLMPSVLLACLLSDGLLYLAGRVYGERVLKRICHLAGSSAGCLRATEAVFRRFGLPTLLFAKFIPGFSSLMTCMAGVMGMGARVFIVLDLVGSALWAGSALLLGWKFHASLDDIIHVFETMGAWGIVALVCLAAVAIAGRLISKHCIGRRSSFAKEEADAGAET